MSNVRTTSDRPELVEGPFVLLDYGIHWPEIDEDLSTEGLLRGAPAPAKAA